MNVDLQGVASGVHLGFGAHMHVFNTGSAAGMVISNGGSAIVTMNAKLENTTVQNGGVEYVWGGGSAYNTTGWRLSGRGQGRR